MTMRVGARCQKFRVLPPITACPGDSYPPAEPYEFAAAVAIERAFDARAPQATFIPPAVHVSLILAALCKPSFVHGEQTESSTTIELKLMRSASACRTM
jgi:hypothetical protein